MPLVSNNVYYLKTCNQARPQGEPDAMTWTFYRDFRYSTNWLFSCGLNPSPSTVL